IGALSQSAGLYTLVDMPPGTYTVEVVRIGFGSESTIVSVDGGQESRADFTLQTQALALDEVVVTGTPGGARVRSIGNDAGRLHADEIIRVSPVRSIQDLIGAREPGVTFNRLSGNVGAGSEIRIRGTSTFGLGNQPLIYVDGIRVDNQAGVGPEIYDGRQAT